MAERLGCVSGLDLTSWGSFSSFYCYFWGRTFAFHLSSSSFISRDLQFGFNFGEILAFVVLDFGGSTDFWQSHSIQGCYLSCAWHHGHMYLGCRVSFLSQHHFSSSKFSWHYFRLEEF